MSRGQPRPPSPAHAPSSGEAGDGLGQRQAPPREEQAGKGSGLGALWILLAPLACCGGPLIIGALAAAGALAWGALGLGLALVLATAVILVVRHRRRSRACCPPAPAGSTQPADRFPAR